MAPTEVLVVDDDQDIREILVEYLQSEGYTVHQAPNGKLALEQLRTHPEPLVVVLDVLMPVMGGFAVLQAAAEHTALLMRHAYVIMAATKRTPPPEVAALIEQRQIPYLLKPFDMADILAAIEIAVGTLNEPASG
jgi:two-component system response regulator CpxR